MHGVQAGNAASTSSNGSGAPPSNPSPAPIPNVDAPPPFLSKTYDMVDDPSTDAIVSWSPGNNSFVVWNHAEFGRDLLPKYFKHNNFSSFVRQLNTYGFRKVDSDRFEFANENFLRGQKHLLKSIRRRKPTHGQNQQQPQQLLGKSPTVGACVEVGKFGLEEEVDRLKRDKNVLMQELVRLRQQQQATDNQLQTVVQHLQGMEQRQQQMMSFLAKAVQSPGFLAQFVQQQTESNRRVTEANKKRRLKREEIPEGERSAAPSDGQIVKYQPPISEAAKEMLRQMFSGNHSDSSPRLEAFESNSSDFAIGDGSPSFGAIDSGSPTHRVSGVTLQEVPPTSGQSYLPAASGISGCSPSASLSEIQSSSPRGTTNEIVTAAHFTDMSALAGAEEAPSVSLPQSDVMMLDVSEIPDVVRENIVDISKEEGVFMDSSSGVYGSMPFEIDDICPDPDIDGLIDDNSNFWEQLLAGIPDEIDSTFINGLSMGNDAQQLENGQEKNEHMDQLTEQMGLLTSDTKSV